MATYLRRMMLTPHYFTRTDPFAKFHLSDLSGYIKRTAEMATLLDAEVALGMERAGLDPTDWENELDNAVCDLSHCRNEMEELHAMLCCIRDVALMAGAERQKANVQ